MLLHAGHPAHHIHSIHRQRAPSRIGSVIRVTSGNFIEMYDFFLFGFYATYISRAFFPATSKFAGLMMTFVTFGAGFFMRPLGAILLGSSIDRIGRRKGLVLIGRLLQVFSAGVELGGVSVCLSEMATPGNKGFYVSYPPRLLGDGKKIVL